MRTFRTGDSVFKKKKAAQKAGAELIVIARPKEEGKSLQEVKKLMEEFLAKENLL